MFRLPRGRCSRPNVAVECFIASGPTSAAMDVVNIKINVTAAPPARSAAEIPANYLATAPALAGSGALRDGAALLGPCRSVEVHGQVVEGGCPGGYPLMPGQPAVAAPGTRGGGIVSGESSASRAAAGGHCPQLLGRGPGTTRRDRSASADKVLSCDSRADDGRLIRRRGDDKGLPFILPLPAFPQLSSQISQLIGTPGGNREAAEVRFRQVAESAAAAAGLAATANRSEEPAPAASEAAAGRSENIKESWRGRSPAARRARPWPPRR